MRVAIAAGPQAAEWRPIGVPQGPIMFCAKHGKGWVFDCSGCTNEEVCVEARRAYLFDLNDASHLRELRRFCLLKDEHLDDVFSMIGLLVEALRAGTIAAYAIDSSKPKPDFCSGSF